MNIFVGKGDYVDILFFGNKPVFPECRHLLFYILTTEQLFYIILENYVYFESLAFLVCHTCTHLHLRTVQVCVRCKCCEPLKAVKQSPLLPRSLPMSSPHYSLIRHLADLLASLSFCAIGILNTLEPQEKNECFHSFLDCSSNHLHGLVLNNEEAYGLNCSSFVLRNECAPSQGGFQPPLAVSAARAADIRSSLVFLYLYPSQNSHRPFVL